MHFVIVQQSLYNNINVTTKEFTKKSKTYQEIAVENELTSAQTAENEVNRAYEKLRKYIKSLRHTDIWDEQTLPFRGKKQIKPMSF